MSGKHWKMPDLSVDNVDVVPLNPSSTEDKTDTDDVMMTSDGDFERIPPVVVEETPSASNTPERESPSSLPREESPVVFDDDPEFFNSNDNNNVK